jgi:hypothetical protein
MSWFPPTKLVNNTVFTCKALDYQCIINEQGINSTIDNRTYTPTTLSKDEILQIHESVLNTLNVPGHAVDDYELPYFYWLPKLHKALYKNALLVPKMFYKTTVNTPYKDIVPQYMPEVGLTVDSQKLDSLKSPFPLSNLQHQNLWFYNTLCDHTS